ncbi:glycine--tRNA ligase subunit beta [bacterium]|nr:glycine--tRNA ligase subunit beta [bacterium]
MSKYLLEIGTEELPYKFVPSAISQLKTLWTNFLNDNGFVYVDIKILATPRRLTTIIDGLERKQKDVEKILKGPIATIAYDANKNLTPAGLGFAKKNGVDASQLYVEDNYVYAKVQQKGKTFDEVVKSNVESLILKMTGSHFMRWADLDVKFQRPIRWVVSILDNENLEVEIANIKSSKFTRGHRFADMNVEITSIDKYEEILEKACVIVDQDKRMQMIVDSANSEAQKIGAKAVMPNDLLEEVTHLCEYPKPVVCSFEEKFLKIPEKVIVTTMATHQRYFPLYKDGKLLNKFITITNYVGDEFENIKRGNERVVVARLDDAIFFFNDDTKQKLEDKLEDLKGITFQRGMGTMYEKTQRIIDLSSAIAKELGVESADIQRCAKLCKCDLATKLVFEFTELQGAIGADYAKVSGEKENVAQGVEEHYFPLSADSDLASSIEGQVVGIADKIDTVCAVFADGKKPTGSQDPLGVRRATLGIMKTIINKNLKINLTELIAKSLKMLPKQPENFDKTLEEIIEFFEQRLSILYSDKYSNDVIDAAISNKNVLADLKDFVNRLDVLSNLVKASDYSEFHEAINRVIRITKTADVKLVVDEKLIETTEEKALYSAVKNIAQNDLSNEVLVKELNKIVPTITTFFDKTLVMDERENVKDNRLALLLLTKSKFEKIADFSKVSFVK